PNRRPQEQAGQHDRGQRHDDRHDRPGNRHHAAIRPSVRSPEMRRMRGCAPRGTISRPPPRAAVTTRRGSRGSLDPMSTTADSTAPEDAETPPSSVLPTRSARLTGWGRTAPSTARVLSTPDVELISRAVAEVAERAETHDAHKP